MRIYFLLFCLVAFSVGLYGQEVREELTPDDVIEMVQAGLSLKTVVAGRFETPFSEAQPAKKIGAGRQKRLRESVRLRRECNLPYPSSVRSVRAILAAFVFRKL